MIIDYEYTKSAALKSGKMKFTEGWTLLPILRFVLDEKFQQNASKFGIFYTYENPNFVCPISCYFTISLMNALVYVDIDQGIH